MTTTDAGPWSQPIPAPRRRASAQKRLRAEADKLESFAVRLPYPVRKDPDDEPAGVTAAQLRLVADLLDDHGFGQS